MNSDSDGKSKSNKVDPEELTRLLEIELAQKRVAWVEAGTRYRKIRTVSLLFLALVVIGALAAFFFLFMRLGQERPPGAMPAVTVSPSP